MPDAVLTRERILEAAEDVLRRYGPAKANVVDVARALGVSHGSVYRHFPSKASLRDAVTERWLARIAEPLEAVAGERGPAPERLTRWLDLLVASKRRWALEEPELSRPISTHGRVARGRSGTRRAPHRPARPDRRRRGGSGEVRRRRPGRRGAGRVQRDCAVPQSGPRRRLVRAVARGRL